MRSNTNDDFDNDDFRPLAGCTGGSGGEMDTDAINDLIDQNLQDFINVER